MNIRIVEKTEDIQYEQISEVLRLAHQEHLNKNIIMKNPFKSPAEIKKYIGDEGKIFIALDGDRIIGTASIRVISVYRWFHKGKTAEFVMEGIIPEYKGKHVFSMLEKTRVDALKYMGISTITFSTADKNIKRQQIAKKDGYIYVDFYSPNTNHYSVRMFKWLDKCPFTKFYCFFRYLIKKLYYKTRYKPGGIKRFGI